MIETEIFIPKVSRRGFDYTKWRENLWGDMTLHELLDHAAKVADEYQVPDGIEII